MTQERLSLLDLEVLRGIAERYDIDVEPEHAKDDLVQLILEAQEEERDEKESGNNPIMRMNEKKYDIIDDEETYMPGDDPFPLPEKYNVTRVYLLLRDPLWAYAYWDIRELHTNQLLTQYNEEDLVLRVYEISGPTLKAENISDYFDIPITLDDSSWYISLPSSGQTYCVELRCLNDEGKDWVLGRSNIVVSPRLEVTADMLQDSSGEMLVLSGVFEFCESPESDKVPQRIMSLMGPDLVLER